MFSYEMLISENHYRITENTWEDNHPVWEYDHQSTFRVIFHNNKLVIYNNDYINDEQIYYLLNNYSQIVDIYREVVHLTDTFFQVVFIFDYSDSDESIINNDISFLKKRLTCHLDEIPELPNLKTTDILIEFENDRYGKRYVKKSRL